MTNQQTFHNPEEEECEGRLIIRRFTDELAGSNELERLTKAAQVDIDEEETRETKEREEREEKREMKERQRLKLLYENPSNNTDDIDFIASDTARNMLQKSVTDFTENEKPSMLKRMGFAHESTKAKANKMLQDMITSDVETLKASVDGLEEDWKKKNGTVYRLFKKVCNTLDNHKSIFAVFPSQNEYTQALCAGISCLVKAAKNHSEIAELLADSISRISENVTRVSKITLVFQTAAIRQKLADIYAIMFRFYRRAIEWYLKKKLDRALSSFNESLKASFEATEKELDKEIEELYRESNISGQAVVKTVDYKVDSVGQRIDVMDRKIDYMYAVLRQQRSDCEVDDHVAGHRMLDLLWDLWAERQAQQAAEQRQKRLPAAVEFMSPNNIQGWATEDNVITLAKAREYGAVLERYIVGDEGPAAFTAGGSWVAEDGVLPKLRTWMVSESISSRTLWISSPADLEGMTSARASALAVWSAAWQAKTPLISHFCRRPRREELRGRGGMSAEQVGLLGLVHSFLFQLIQFRRAEDTVNISEETLKTLDGRKESWETSLTALEALLGNAPVQTYCVIDGLNDLEFGDGVLWGQQLLKVLFARQHVEGVTFNILFTTAGQSRILASGVALGDRYLAQRPARELERWGERLELEAPMISIR